MKTKATPEQITDLANTIALQAEALSQEFHSNTALSRALLILSNAEMLVAWCQPEEK